jgi:hypothetical protein
MFFFPRRPLFLITFSLSLFLLFLSIFLPLWKLPPVTKTQTMIALHSSPYFGVDLLGPWYHVFFLPLLGAVLLMANMSFVSMLYQKEELLSTFFAVGTVLCEAVLFVGVLFVVLLNI